MSLASSSILCPFLVTFVLFTLVTTDNSSRNYSYEKGPVPKDGNAYPCPGEEGIKKNLYCTAHFYLFPITVRPLLWSS